jgi:hypothetical protein
MSNLVAKLGAYMQDALIPMHMVKKKLDKGRERGGFNVSCAFWGASSL